MWRTAAAVRALARRPVWYGSRAAMASPSTPSNGPTPPSPAAAVAGAVAGAAAGAAAAEVATRVLPVRVTVTRSTLDAFDAAPADAASAAALQEAAETLRRGQTVAFPTETVYGLGADALSADATRRIFEAKCRPSDNPLIVHVASLAMVDGFATVPDAARPVLARFWPGPLTLLLPKRLGVVPDTVTCGLPTVAVRMPAHPVARYLIQLADTPIAAPSANLSGRPSPTTARHVAEDLSGRVPIILDGGAAQVGVESTVVDLLQNPPVLLRPGGVTYEQLRPLLPTLRVYRKDFVSAALEAQPTTPGMKYRHYSPEARVILLEPAATATNSKAPALDEAADRLRAAVLTELAALRAGTEPFAIVRTHARHAATLPDLVPWQGIEHAHSVAPPRGIDYVLGDVADPAAVAQGLFAALRDLDAAGVRAIVVEGISDAHEGLAVMNRLRKAASVVRTV